MTGPRPGKATALGRNTVRFRKARGWTQAVLAAEASLTATLVSQVERGLVSSSPVVLAKLAKALEVEEAGLLAEYDPVPALDAATARAAFHAALSTLQAAAAKAAREPGREPASVYLPLAERVRELADTVRAKRTPRA